MFLSKLFKHARARAMVVLAGLTMILGAGAAITSVAATKQNEVVETKADDARTIYITNNYSCTNLRVHYWGSSDQTVGMTEAYTNTSSQKVYKATLPSGTTGWQFIGYYGSWSRDTYSLDQSVPSNDSSGYYIHDTSGDGGSKFYMKTWSVTFFTVVFDSNGGTGSMSNKTCYCNANAGNNLTTNTFTRSGYVFKGWNTSAGGGGNAYSDGAHINHSTSGATVILYAQWVYNSGYYLIGTGINGSTGDFLISEAVPSGGNDESNAAKFEGVTISSGARWKIVWWDSATSAITHWFNTDFAGQHLNHTWATPHGSNNIACSSAGTYKVYLSSDLDDANKKISVNQDLTITYYEVKGGSTSASKTTTGNSDIQLSTTLSGKFTEYDGYTITGYYTDSSCETPVKDAEHVTSLDVYPTAAMSVYAKYTINTYNVTEHIVFDHVDQGTTVGKTVDYGTYLRNVAHTDYYGYNFDGYFTYSEGSYHAYPSNQQVTSAMNVYALYSSSSDGITLFYAAAGSDKTNLRYVEFTNGVSTGMAKTKLLNNDHGLFSFVVPYDATSFILCNSDKSVAEPSATIASRGTNNLYVIAESTDNFWAECVFTLRGNELFVGDRGDEWTVDSAYVMTPPTNVSNGNQVEVEDIVVAAPDGASYPECLIFCTYIGTDSQPYTIHYKALGTSYDYCDNGGDQGNVRFKAAGTYSVYLNASGQIFITSETENKALGYVYMEVPTSASNIMVSAGSTSAATEHLDDVRLSTLGGYAETSALSFSSSSGGNLVKFKLWSLGGTSGERPLYWKFEVNSVSSPAIEIPNASNTPIYYVDGRSPASATMATGDSATAAVVAFDIERAMSTATSQSVCNLSPDILTGLVSEYETAAGTSAVKALLEGASIETYNNVSAYSSPSTGKADMISDGTKGAVLLGNIYMQMCKLIGHTPTATPSYAIRIPSISSKESPLTMTLWIVLGCGVAGLGAIGAAYFVSKKKKRYQA